ncbi:unnamed protein product, partial [Meganyctiphanes norvegica]
MSAVGSTNSGSQLNPLLPLGEVAAPPNTMKVLENVQQQTGPQTNSALCKRLSPDNNTEGTESENAPIGGHKRQRTKSGSEMDNMVVSPLIGSECYGKSGSEVQVVAPPPLCERNSRTLRTDGLEENSTESSCSVASRDNNDVNISSYNNSISSNIGDCNDVGKLDSKNNRQLSGNETKDTQVLLNGCSSIENISNDISGAESPQCSATLDYVTQLPEGCSGSKPSTAASSSILESTTLEPRRLDTSLDSDVDLEDDDNYLDSSEGEDDTDMTTTLGDEDESCGEDDNQSVISSVTIESTCSLRSVASEVASTISLNEQGQATNEDGSLLYNSTPSTTPLPSFNVSLFSHVPPAINFCKYNEKTDVMPSVIQRLLKWRLTNITPLIVKKTVTNSGFKMTKKTALWNGTWGKHMKSPLFKDIREFQKLNHFPGTFQIGRKDKLWKNFVRLQTKFGKEEFGFIPKTFVLPGEMKAFKTAFDKEGVKKKWIVKPPASARGTGIQVIHKWSQIPSDGPVVVQRYISKPYLINGTKFDMRIYVLVTSFHPLRIYLFQDGLVRFASVQYKTNSATLEDRYMHLTNYSVNKTSATYTHNEDAGQCQGSKWTIKALWGYLKAQGCDTAALWSRIADLVIKTIVSGESDIVLRTRRNVRSRYTCHELFGFDVILDEKLHPWLLEVNISPSLHSASPLDHSVKGPLISDLLNMVAFHIPDKLSHQQQTTLLNDLKLGEGVSGLCLDRRMYTRLLTTEELSKHVRINGQSRSEYLATVLENITPDDLRYLIMYEDERARSGGFSCIFPTQESHLYFAFLEKSRYYNILMDAWESIYGTCRQKGIDRLEALCAIMHHLQVPQKFKLPKTAIPPPPTPNLSSSPRQQPLSPKQKPSSPSSTG